MLCEAARPIVKERLRARYEAGTEQEKLIRRNLGELNDEYIARIDRRYVRLRDDGWFDLTVATDLPDVKHNTDILLAKLGAPTN